MTGSRGSPGDVLRGVLGLPGASPGRPPGPTVGETLETLQGVFGAGTGGTGDEGPTSGGRGLPGLPRSAGTGGGGAGGGGRDAADRGPDRVMEMEGGNRFLLARRRAHRKDLLKEALNVGIGSVLVGLLSGALLHGLGVGLDATVLVALGTAAAGGWTLGREVLVDLVENERAVKRGGWPR